jgi:hypothetical protein
MSMRRVNKPMPAQVRVGRDGAPERISWQQPQGRGRRQGTVEHVLDTWSVDDAWWTRQPVRRMYYECQLAGGVRMIAVYDRITGSWYAQR